MGRSGRSRKEGAGDPPRLDAETRRLLKLAVSNRRREIIAYKQAERLKALEFGDDALGEHLPEPDTPLAERVDAPDAALAEDAVFVEGDKLAERRRRQALGEDRVDRPMALEDAMQEKLG